MPRLPVYLREPVSEDGRTDQTDRAWRKDAMAGYPLIDIYCHIFPDRFFQEMTRVAPNLTNIGQRLRNVKKLFDLDLRFREMDDFGDYRQVISLPNPPIEDLAKGPVGQELARIGNDAMAELVQKYPDRFAGFVGAVSLTDVEGSIAETRRAINDLGASGIQVFTSIAGRPLDDPAFRPIFAEMAKLDLPIWLHPGRTAAMTDYAGEPKSRYEMWWCFGWPYDTSVAMSRLVFSGLFDRHSARPDQADDRGDRQAWPERRGPPKNLCPQRGEIAEDETRLSYRARYRRINPPTTAATNSRMATGIQIRKAPTRTTKTMAARVPMKSASRMMPSGPILRTWMWRVPAASIQTQ